MYIEVKALNSERQAHFVCMCVCVPFDRFHLNLVKSAPSQRNPCRWVINIAALNFLELVFVVVIVVVEMYLQWPMASDSYSNADANADVTQSFNIKMWKKQYCAMWFDIFTICFSQFFSHSMQ